ncbi:hypothetical protein BIW11_13123 [Tropilaelaps mercedesae]|uniref:Uncharacterized protein n=1 Tax=Tropilaelaps mercedesae TaxID=418985 RepID=A0A1V9X3D8_9ACAR|nr:hypothetical protein BIW11_13123 [Tropilaelaps mercedesae]
MASWTPFTSTFNLTPLIVNQDASLHSTSFISTDMGYGYNGLTNAAGPKGLAECVHISSTKSEQACGEKLAWTEGRTSKCDTCCALAKGRGVCPRGWTPLNSSFQLVHLLSGPDTCVPMTCWQRDGALGASCLPVSESGAAIVLSRSEPSSRLNRGGGDAP